MARRDACRAGDGPSSAVQKKSRTSHISNHENQIHDFAGFVAFQFAARSLEGVLVENSFCCSCDKDATFTKCANAFSEHTCLHASLIEF